MQTAILIAVRIYLLSDARGVEYECRDFMYRMPCGGFVLKLTSDMPGEPEDEKSFSLAGVFAWLNELPWQIKRVVYP